MKFDRDRAFAGAVAVGAVALGLLLLRENEGRVKAEAKVRDQALRIEALTNEQGRTISNLETENAELETKLRETILGYEEKLAALAEERQKISAELEQSRATFENEVKAHATTAKERDARIASLEATRQKDAAANAEALKKKNGELAELASQLKQASARYEKLLAENRALESEAVDVHNRAERLETDLKKLELENAYLNRAAAARQAAAGTPETAD